MIHQYKSWFLTILLALANIAFPAQVTEQSRVDEVLTPYKKERQKTFLAGMQEAITRLGRAYSQRLYYQPF